MFWGTITTIMCFAVKRYGRNRKLHVGDVDRIECAVEWFLQKEVY